VWGGGLMSASEVELADSRRKPDPIDPRGSAISRSRDQLPAVLSSSRGKGASAPSAASIKSHSISVYFSHYARSLFIRFRASCKRIDIRGKAADFGSSSCHKSSCKKRRGRSERVTQYAEVIDIRLFNRFVFQ
jgi:hypothetical protein